MNTTTDKQHIIFISHKHQTANKAARVIKEKFKLYGSGRLEIKLAEDMPAGTDWRKWINDNVPQANTMLFLCTCQDEGWEWCVYEAGVFNAKRDPSTRNLIVLHSPVVERPGPLDNLQAVEAKVKNMKLFLKDFFGTNKYIDASPINPDFANNDATLSTVAEEICQHFATGLPTTRRFGNYFTLSIEQSDDMEDSIIPDDATIESDAVSLRIFGLGEQPVSSSHWTWSDLKKRITGQENALWMKSLGKAIESAIEHGIVEKPISETYQSKVGKIYSIVIESLNISTTGPMKFRILLVEQSAKSTIYATDHRFSALLSSMVLGNRLQWEVCNHYLFALDNHSATYETLCQELADKIATIEAEARFRGSIDSPRYKLDERITYAFDQDDPRRQEVADNQRNQNVCKDQLLNAIESGQDKTKIKEKLTHLRVLNNQLMLCVSQRYHELLDSIRSDSAITPETVLQAPPSLIEQPGSSPH